MIALGFAAQQLSAQPLETAGKAVTEPIPLINPSFEEEVLDTPGTWHPLVTGWLQVPNNGKGTYRPTPTDFNEPVPDGFNVAYINTGSNRLQQTTAEIVEEGVTYMLTVQVGNRTVVSPPEYQISLLVDDQIVAESREPAIPDGGFVTSTTQFTASAVQAGLPLAVRLDSLTPSGFLQVNFDDVRLVKQRQAVIEVPTLSTAGQVLLLCLLPLIAFGILRRRGV